MNNTLRFLTRICELGAFGVDYQESAKKLKSVYLISDDDLSKYLALMTNRDFLSLKTLSQVQIHKNFINAYAVDVFGAFDKEEQLLLNAKHEALKKINAVCEKEQVGIEDFGKYATNAYVKSIIGFGCVFGFFDVGDYGYGIELIDCAARDGDVDAKLYLLTVKPESAKEILTDIANTSEYLYKFSHLRAWLEHYNVKDVKIKHLTGKVGFGL